MPGCGFLQHAGGGDELPHTKPEARPCTVDSTRTCLWLGVRELIPTTGVLQKPTAWHHCLQEMMAKLLFEGL
ncbi:hypothetical protein PUN28_015252 [Cardiocondyla obscurior]|uniref:Uncharacterized protein n=1 Tax=Cardiocondyla obscurior TaxID=286306 RepID=A0AAW2F0M5_9HYME